MFEPRHAEVPIRSRYGCPSKPKSRRHSFHSGMDVGAAKLWLSRRQPDKWKDRQEVNVTGTVAHRLAQMTPEERGAFARDLAAQAHRRLVEAGVIIEHQRAAEPEADEDG